MNTETEEMNYRIDDEHGYLEGLEKCKATLESQVEKYQMAFDGIDFNDGWSVARARMNARTNKTLDQSFQRYLSTAHKIECLNRAKKIAEADDSIEVVEFSGGYSGGQNVRIWCDHDNQYVAVLA